MSRLEDLYSKMIDEAPIYFNESQKKYFLELAEIYAKECSQASLEKAIDKGRIDYTHNEGYFINEESITNPENIVLL